MARKKARKQVVTKHNLVPKHEKISEKDKKAILEQYNITLKELPKILKDDPVLSNMSIKQGDVIKITRASKTAGESHFYRVVADV